MSSAVVLASGDALPEMLPAALPAPNYPRRRAQFVTTAFLATGSVLTVMALLGRYLAFRSDRLESGVWLDGVVVPLTQPNVMVATLLISSVIVQWAVYAIARDDRTNAYWALGIALLMGLAFLNQNWFLFSFMGLGIGEHPEAPYFYGVVVTHMVFTAIALVYLAAMTARALAGQYNSRYPDGISSVALYWHAMVLCYVPIWYGVYIMK